MLLCVQAGRVIAAPPSLDAMAHGAQTCTSSMLLSVHVTLTPAADTQLPQAAPLAPTQVRPPPHAREARTPLIPSAAAHPPTTHPPPGAPLRHAGAVGLHSVVRGAGAVLCRQRGAAQVRALVRMQAHRETVARRRLEDERAFG